MSTNHPSTDSFRDCAKPRAKKANAASRPKRWQLSVRTAILTVTITATYMGFVCNFTNPEKTMWIRIFGLPICLLIFTAFAAFWIDGLVNVALLVAAIGKGIRRIWNGWRKTRAS